MTSAAVEPEPDVAHRPHHTQSTRLALLWSYVLSGGGFVLSGMVTFIMAAILGPREFGIMALAMLWISFAQMLLHEGPTLAVIQREQVTASHLNAAFWVNLGLASVLASLLVAVAPLWAALYDLRELLLICWALAPVIVLHALVVVPDAVLRRQMELRRLSIRVLISMAASGTAGVAAAVAGLGVWALVIQQLVFNTVSVAVLWSTTPWRPGWGGIGSGIRDLRRFSLLSQTDFLAYFVASRADALLVGVFFGPVAVGLYRFAHRIVEMVTSLASGGVVQIALADLARFNHDRRAFAARLGQLLHTNVVLTLPVLGVVAASARPLLAFLGEEWVPAAPALRILCLVGGVMVIGLTLAPAMQAAGRPGISAVISWTEAVLAAGTISAVGYSLTGSAQSTQVLGIAIAALSVQVVINVVTIQVMFRRVLAVPLAPVLLPAVPAVLAGAVAAGAGWGMERLVGAVSGVPVLDLALLGLIGTGAAAAVLLVCDRRVVGQVRPVLGLRGSPRGRHAAPRSHLVGLVGWSSRQGGWPND